jgi:hypothetical protein
MLVVRGFEHFFCLPSRHINPEPAFVRRLYYIIVGDTKADKPVPNRLDGVFRRCEHVIDLFCCPVLAIVLRIRRTNVHEIGIGMLQVALAKT